MHIRIAFSDGTAPDVGYHCS